METGVFKNLWDLLYYLLVLVSWKLRRIWDYLETGSEISENPVQRTPQNTKKHQTVLRSRRFSSLRRNGADLSKSRRSSLPRHFSKNLFGESNSDPCPPSSMRTIFTQSYEYSDSDEDVSLRPMDINIFDAEFSRVL